MANQNHPHPLAGDPIEAQTFGKLEADPTGRSAHQPGAKLDAGKSPVMRGVLHYFPRALAAVATVSNAGARKYTWKGWETVPDGINRYGDALGRHILCEDAEGMYDRDTGLLHAAHAAWNALARLELLLRNGTAGTVPPTGTTADINACFAVCQYDLGGRDEPCDTCAKISAEAPEARCKHNYSAINADKMRCTYCGHLADRAR